MSYAKTLMTSAVVFAIAAGWSWWKPGAEDAVADAPLRLETALPPAGTAAAAAAVPAVTTPRPIEAAHVPTSDGLRDLLAAIDGRSRALDAREASLEARLATLQTLEHSVGDALTHLEAGGCAAGTSASGRLRGGVTRIYENMRAEQAAAILDRLDDDTLRVVFAGMDPRRIGAIMAEMSRERAVAFTRTLAADTAAAAPGPEAATLARR